MASSTPACAEGAAGRLATKCCCRTTHVSRRRWVAAHPPHRARQKAAHKRRQHRDLVERKATPGRWAAILACLQAYGPFLGWEHGGTHAPRTWGDFCSRMCLAGSRETLTVKPENASDTGIRLPAPTTACLAVKRCWSVLVAGRPLRGSLPLYPTTHSVPAILNQRLGPVDVPTSEPGVLETMGRTNPRAGASSARQEATTPAETISRQKTSAAAG